MRWHLNAKILLGVPEVDLDIGAFTGVTNERNQALPASSASISALDGSHLLIWDAIDHEVDTMLVG